MGLTMTIIIFRWTITLTYNRGHRQSQQRAPRLLEDMCKDTAGHLRGEDTSIRQRDWQPVSEQINRERENASLSGKGNAFITESWRCLGRTEVGLLLACSSLICLFINTNEMLLKQMHYTILFSVNIHVFTVQVNRDGCRQKLYNLCTISLLKWHDGFVWGYAPRYALLL